MTKVEEIKTAIVMDLPTISRNFPAVPKPEIFRENILSTIESVLEGDVHFVAVEGIEGTGKTTLLFSVCTPKFR